jgi:uncharacterized protein DUF1571
MMRPLAHPLFSIVAVIAALLVADSQVSAQAPPTAPVVQQAAVRPVDEAATAMGWIQEAQNNYRTAIRDYKCVFVARENLHGKQGEDQIIHMKLRQQPFSVYMNWARPKSMEGQEVAYVQGKNGNNLRVRNPGLLRVTGFMSIDINDKRTLEHSRHTIVEAGIGNLIDRTAQNWQFDRQSGKAVTHISEYVFDNRPCYKVETIHMAKLPQFYSYKGVIYLEKNSKYPIRNENYSWPVPGGNPAGDLMESFSYTQIEWNKGLKDADFDR